MFHGMAYVSPPREESRTMNQRTSASPVAIVSRGWTRGTTLLVLLAIVYASASGCRTTPSVPEDQPTEGRAVLIRGLMDVFSLGMNSVAERLAEEGFEATAISGAVRAQEGQRLIEAAQADELSRPLVIVGHSYGGDAAVRLCRQLDRANVPVDKLILVDATTPPPVPGSVRRVFNIYRSSPGTDWVPVLRGVAINERRRERDLPETHVINFDLRKADAPELKTAKINHFTIDESKAVQDLVVEQALAVREESRGKPASQNAPPESGESPYQLLSP
jgi:pimeloyl-ACP methyl ester carboxylesterase